MKITKSQLKQIIKEETATVISEQDLMDWPKEMKRILTDIKHLHEAIGRNNPDDLEIFEEFFNTNIGGNFPWIKPNAKIRPTSDDIDYEVEP